MTESAVFYECMAAGVKRKVARQTFITKENDT